jgi:hypothetical protein
MDETDSRGKASFDADLVETSKSLSIGRSRKSRDAVIDPQRERSGTCIRRLFESDDDRSVQAADRFSSRSYRSGRLISTMGIISAVNGAAGAFHSLPRKPFVDRPSIRLVSFLVRFTTRGIAIIGDRGNGDGEKNAERI